MSKFLISGYLNFLRAEHGARKLRYEKGGLDYAAYEATNAVCSYGMGKCLILAILWAFINWVFFQHKIMCN